MATFQQGPPAPPLSTTAIDRINFAIQLEKYRDMVFKRWWIIAICLIVSISYGSWQAYNKIDEFVAEGRMMVQPQITGPVSDPFGEEWSNFFGTQRTLMESPMIAEAAKAKLSEFVKTLTTDGVPPRISLQVDILKGTSIFKLTARSTNRDYAIKFIDEVMKEYIAYKKRMQEQTTDTAQATLVQETERQKREYERAEAKLFEFQKEHNIPVIDGVSSMSAQYLVDLKRRLADVQTEMDLLNTETPEQRLERSPVLNVPQTESTNTVSEAQTQYGLTKGVGGSSEYTLIKNAIYILRQEREDLSKFLRPRHPKIMRLTEELEKKKRLLALVQDQTKDQIARYRDSLIKQAEALKKSIQEWEAKAFEANEILSKFQILKADVERAKTFYEALNKKMNEIQIAGGIRQDLITVHQKASGSMSPVGASRSKTVVMSGLIGLAVAIAIILLLDRFDDRVKTIEELQGLIEEPVLGQIPLIPGHRKDSPPLLMSDLPEHNTFAESFRHVRSSLMFSPLGGQAKSIVVTSAIPGDGKTTCSVNLALCLAQIEGARMLLIDGDMRKMNVHSYFKMPNDKGLSEILSGQASFSQCIVSTGIQNLDVLRAGSAPPNPGELLLSENFKTLLGELGKIYHRIVIDTPPVMSTDDTLSLAPSVDGVIFIVKANQTSFRFVDKCMTGLKQRGARVFGVVLNHIDTTSAHYYYYNYYSGYYSYSSRQRHATSNNLSKASAGASKKLA
jgi:polysaccharide biosynthesis transport protein